MRPSIIKLDVFRLARTFSIIKMRLIHYYYTTGEINPISAKMTNETSFVRHFNINTNVKSGETVCTVYGPMKLVRFKDAVHEDNTIHIIVNQQERDKFYDYVMKIYFKPIKDKIQFTY